MRAAAALLTFALAGQWVTTPAGDRVCRLTISIEQTMTLQPGFCEDWQPGFVPLQRGMTFPFHEGWVRRSAPWPAQGYIQLHVEGQWVP